MSKLSCFGPFVVSRVLLVLPTNWREFNGLNLVCETIHNRVKLQETAMKNTSNLHTAHEAAFTGTAILCDDVTWSALIGRIDFLRSVCIQSVVELAVF